MLSLYANLNVAQIRYLQDPPGVDCQYAASMHPHLQDEAFIEYLEYTSGNLDSFFDPDLDVNKIASRQGFYVCFCKE